MTNSKWSNFHKIMLRISAICAKLEMIKGYIAIFIWSWMSHMQSRILRILVWRKKYAAGNKLEDIIWEFLNAIFNYFYHQDDQSFKRWYFVMKFWSSFNYKGDLLKANMTLSIKGTFGCLQLKKHVFRHIILQRF